MPLATKIKNFKAESVSYVKTDFGETNDGKKFSKDYFKYNHGEKEGGTIKGAATFKADFEITFPNGLYFETSENSKYKKLQGKGQLDMSNKKVCAFADSPKRGLKDGWVHVKDVESVEFNTLKAKKEIPVYTEASKDEEKGKIKEGTILTSDSKDDDFFHVTYGGGEKGMLHELRRGVAKALYKNRKAAGLKVKSEKELEELIKFPIYFHTDDDGNETDRASWYLKITYKESSKEGDGWLAKFEVPGVRELTLEEMLNNRITGRPCFKLQSLYRGGTNRSMQIFLSSMVVTDFAPIEYTSAQQDDIDELGNNPEFVERMRGLIPEKPPIPHQKGKKGKASKKVKAKPVESDDDPSDSEEETDMKKIIAPSLEKVDVDQDSEDSDDEPVPGISKEELQKKENSSDDESEEEPSPKVKKGKKSKKNDSEDVAPAPKTRAKAKKPTTPPSSETDDSSDDSD